MGASMVCTIAMNACSSLLAPGRWVCEGRLSAECRGVQQVLLHVRSANMQKLNKSNRAWPRPPPLELQSKANADSKRHWSESQYMRCFCSGFEAEVSLRRQMRCLCSGFEAKVSICDACAPDLCEDGGGGDPLGRWQHTHSFIKSVCLTLATAYFDWKHGLAELTKWLYNHFTIILQVILQMIDTRRTHRSLEAQIALRRLRLYPGGAGCSLETEIAASGLRLQTGASDCSSEYRGVQQVLEHVWSAGSQKLKEFVRY